MFFFDKVPTHTLHIDTHNTLRKHPKVNKTKQNKKRSAKIPRLREMDSNELADMQIDKNVRGVIIGMDINFTYWDISLASRYLNEINETIFIASNDDNSDIIKPGIQLAGTGSLLASIQITTHKKMIVCGKPYQLLFQIISHQFCLIILYIYFFFLLFVFFFCCFFFVSL